jgi:ABC-2 type transport system permease protein
VYRQPLRFVLTDVLPVAFISTVPAWALTRGAGPALIIVGLVIGIGAIAIVQIVWRAGLKRYTSATS